MTFVQSLTEATKAVKNSLLVVSLACIGCRAGHARERDARSITSMKSVALQVLKRYVTSGQ